eukprot:364277-Chlamydomonas_euryale.AAC.11
MTVSVPDEARPRPAPGRSRLSADETAGAHNSAILARGTVKRAHETPRRANAIAGAGEAGGPPSPPWSSGWPPRGVAPPFRRSCRGKNCRSTLPGRARRLGEPATTHHLA